MLCPLQSLHVLLTVKSTYSIAQVMRKLEVYFLQKCPFVCIFAKLLKKSATNNLESSYVNQELDAKMTIMET